MQMSRLPARRWPPGRTREELLGRHVFAAFRDNLADPGATGVRNLNASLSLVVDASEANGLSLLRYDVGVPGSPGVFARRYLSSVNAPLFGPDGSVALIAHWLEEITERVSSFIEGLVDSDVPVEHA